VDKTRYVELLEDENNRYQFFIRPRRFGKSLFLSVLENYYDLSRKDKFEALFKEFYIGKNSTPEQGKYAVIQFDFSGLNTDSHEEFKKSFSMRVQNAVLAFLNRYKSYFPNAEVAIQNLNETGIGAIDVAYNSAADANIPIFAIIDEYDHFANNLIAMGKTYRDDVMTGCIVRSFYELLKVGTKSVVKRIFITGVSPMMSDLMNGLNMAIDLSLCQKYNEMFGFTKEEVEWLMQETGIDKNLIKMDMEAYYNGYMFNNNGKNKVCNSQMVLYLFNQILQIGEQPSQIIDTSFQTDYKRLRSLAENNREILLQIIQNSGIICNVVENLPLYRFDSEEYFISLLFYFGMLTNAGIKEGQTYLRTPNYSVKGLYEILL